MRAALLEAGCAGEEIDRHLRELVAGGYSFERHLDRLGVEEPTRPQLLDRLHLMQQCGDAFLYLGTVADLAQLSNDVSCILLTFGDPTFQQRKFAGTPSLHPFFDDTKYVWQE